MPFASICRALASRRRRQSSLSDAQRKEIQQMIDNDFQAQFDRANRAIDALPGLVTSAVQAGVTSALKSTDGARSDNLAGASAVADHLEQAAAQIRASIGSTGADTFNGGQGGDTLPSGGDSTFGGQGADTIFGGQGDNSDLAPAQ